MMVKNSKYLFISLITALAAMYLGMILMWVFGFLYVPAIQAWLTVKYQDSHFLAAAIVTALPWLGIYLWSQTQPYLTKEVVPVACFCAMVGIGLYGVKHYWLSRDY